MDEVLYHHHKIGDRLDVFLQILEFGQPTQIFRHPGLDLGGKLLDLDCIGLDRIRYGGNVDDGKICPRVAGRDYPGKGDERDGEKELSHSVGSACRDAWNSRSACSTSPPVSVRA